MSLLLIVLMAALAGVDATADWDDLGDNHKMHFPQFPDGSGWDVNMTGKTLADDWQCSASGPITGIHFWVSWQSGVPGQLVDIHLSIHDDDRTGPYSKPGTELWSTNLSQGGFSYTMRYAGDGLQGWWDPTTGQAEPDDHFVYYQINCTDFTRPFSQEVATIYWLDINVLTDQGLMGWKTSLDEFEDAAVYLDPTLGWQMLIDPGYGYSNHLAFVIDGPVTQEPEPEGDYGDAPDPPYPTLFANSGAEHMIVAHVRLGPNLDSELDGQPNGTATGDDNDGSDDEDGISFISSLTAGRCAWITAVASTAGVLNAWVDFNIDGDWGDTGEQIFTDKALVLGANTLSFPVPAAAVPGATFARFRFTTSAGIGYDLTALDGEVEDYRVVLEQECPKWIQEPDCEFGMDLSSYAPWTDDPPDELGELYRICDDWLCDGRPVTAVRWWGSYIGWPEGPASPPEPPLGQRPDGFVLRWYVDVPTNESGLGYSMPGTELTNVMVWLDRPGTPMVSETLWCTSDLYFAEEGRTEYEFEYYVELPEPWIEKEGVVYWLSIEAFYYIVEHPQPPEFPWGWKTTPPEWNWNDDAVLFVDGILFDELHYPPAVPPWDLMGITNHPYDGESVNMAYELYTDICPRRCKKWMQPPDMVAGTDMWSWRKQGQSPTGFVLRADDFVSDGRVITDIHWWGSYSNWWHWEEGSPTNPVAPPSHPLYRPLGFDMSWHLSEPQAGPDCLPGPLFTNVFVPIDACHEVFYGSVWQGWAEVPGFEQEYQYYVDLLDTNIFVEAWHEEEGVRYWLNIQAVFTNEFQPNPGEHGGWGWKITEDMYPTNDPCASVYSTNAGLTWAHDRLPPNHVPRPDSLFDLSFELTTTNPPSTNSVWFTPIAFTNIHVNANTRVGRMWTVGCNPCSRQILQGTTNLVGSPVWTNVQTKTIPRSVNVWKALTPGTQGFYRVKQKP